MKKYTFVMAALMSVTAIAHTYTNPVLPGFYPDPSICRVDSDYYLVNSTFQYFPGIPVWHSRDLVNWEQIGNVIDRPEQIDLSGTVSWGGLYAPTIRYNDGVFYMINTNTTHGGNFFVTATDPAGPWSDPNWLEQGGIDPSFYFEDGKCYFTSNPDDAIYLCEIDPVTGRQLSPSQKIWGGTGGRYPEGPHIYKKDGWYYLLAAEGGTEMAHMITIARSKDIYGPYESNPNNPILTHCNQLGQHNPIQGTGHADIIEAPDGSWWLVCLAFRPQFGMNHLTGRETYLVPMVWDENGWPVVNGNKPIQTIMEASLPIQGELLPQTDWSQYLDFTQIDKLGYDWVYLRKPVDGNYSFTENGLVLKGNEWDLNSIEYPTFVGRRQQHINFEATTSLSLDASQPGSQAGLSAFMDVRSHYDIYLAKGDNGYTINVDYWLGSIYHHEVSLEIEGNSAILKIIGDTNNYSFFYSTDGGQNFYNLGCADTKYLSSETAGGFTGIILGLYCIGKETPEATFKYFKYQPL